MAEKEIVREWLKKADEDFLFASSVIEESPYYAQICFHYQQAAEKFLKAFIVANDLELKKIHDLMVLLDICKGREPGLSSIEDESNFLNGYYIDTRYPVHWPTNYTKEEAMKAQKAAGRIGDAIKGLLEKGGHV